MSEQVTEIPKQGDLYDLDEYRRKRIEEGTWPPDEQRIREYWQAIKDRRKTSK